MKTDSKSFTCNCEKAAQNLFMFEKAFPFDRKTTIERIKNLPYPQGLEKEWDLVVCMCNDFEKNNNRLILRNYPLSEVLNFQPTIEYVSRSGQMSAILRQIGDNEIRKNKSKTNNKYIVHHFDELCIKAINLLNGYDSAPLAQKSRIEQDFIDLVPPQGFSEHWKFVDAICKDYFTKGFVKVSDISVPSCASVAVPPFPIRGIDGIKDLIYQISFSKPNNDESENGIEDDYLNDCGSEETHGNLYSDNHKTNSKDIDHFPNTMVAKALMKQSEGTDIKDIVENKYVELINCIISTINEIDSLHGNNSTFRSIKTAFFNRLEDLLDTAEEEMIHTLQHTVWNNLVVAFFGETNAGKSTIIETFRFLFDEQRKKCLANGFPDNASTRIVGTGQADYTKDYNEYEMYIEGRPFTLIDVPGIEGNEEDFVDDIKKALAQAHIVFYVQGHNIKPDVATASKIKKYLGDWVNVFSVYNVRGGAFNYRKSEQRKKLVIGDAVRAEKLIVETFSEILGEVYKGNISLQALLALCAVAKFPAEWQDLVDVQNKVLGQFDSDKSLFAFSQFNNITDLIFQKANNFNEEIAEANKQKLLSLGRFFVSSINHELDTQSGNIDKFSTELKTYKREVSVIFSDTKNKLKNRLFAKNDMLYSSLQQEINDIIDTNSSNSDIKDKIIALCHSFSFKYADEMKIIVKTEIMNMSEKLKKKQKTLDCYESLIKDVYPDAILPDIEIDLSSILAEMEITLSELWTTAAGAVVGAGIGALFGGVGAIPGAMIGSGIDLIRKSIFGDGGKSKAKEKVKKALHMCKDKSIAILQDVINDINLSLSRETAETSSKVDQDLRGLAMINDSLCKAKKALENTINTISIAKYGDL